MGRSLTSPRLVAGLTVLVAAGIAAAGLGGCGSSGPGSELGLGRAASAVVAAPVRVARTRFGPVGYRVVGSGPPLVLIMGFGWTMEDWDPRLVGALARHHRVVLFDNAGVGKTRLLSPTLTIDQMANQASALITTLRLGRPDILGWSMGGMIAQDLALRDPAQVRQLVLCATFPGTGSAALPSAQAQAAAASPVTRSAQTSAVAGWEDGTDAAGHRPGRIAVPTLIADGAEDKIDPVANDHTLARLIPGSRLVLYPDAGHAFLFQEPGPVAARINEFLGSS